MTAFTPCLYTLTTVHILPECLRTYCLKRYANSEVYAYIFTVDTIYSGYGHNPIHILLSRHASDFTGAGIAEIATVLSCGTTAGQPQFPYFI